MVTDGLGALGTVAGRSCLYIETMAPCYMLARPEVSHPTYNDPHVRQAIDITFWLPRIFYYHEEVLRQETCYTRAGYIWLLHLCHPYGCTLWCHYCGTVRVDGGYS